MPRLSHEPYRLFFPLGVLAGMAGAALWPALYAKGIDFYPAEAHARIMTEGFMGAFILGFLGTSLPRLIGSPPLTKPEFLILIPFWLAAVVCHLFDANAAGDVCFVLLILIFGHSLAGRFLFLRKDVPPPGFPLALLGLLGGAAGAVILAASKVTEIPSFTTGLAKSLLYQGFPLLPLLGVGPFILPRFFGHPSPHHFDESESIPPGWWRRALPALAAGLLIVASFVLEASQRIEAGHWLRAAVVLGWFVLESPVFRRALARTTPGTTVRVAVLMLVAGCVTAALYPLQRIGAMHLFFVSGIGLATLAVGTRVVLGHAGRHDLLGGRIKWMRWLIGLVLLAATTRASADFLPAIKVSHHIYAASTWIVSTGLWLWALRKFFLMEEEDEG